MVLRIYYIYLPNLATIISKYYQLRISYESHSESSCIYYCIIYNDL